MTPASAAAPAPVNPVLPTGQDEEAAAPGEDSEKCIRICSTLKARERASCFQVQQMQKRPKLTDLPRLGF